MVEQFSTRAAIFFVPFCYPIQLITPFFLMSFLLPQPGIMSAYVSVLCNFAELYELTGELNHKEEYLSAALTVIKNYEAQLHSPSTTATDPDNKASEQKKNAFPLSQVLHKPVLGRVLLLVAHRELSVGQTVVAEGLYRSAIDNLSSPAALHDPR